MNFSVSLPILKYGINESLRNEYKYADDLINPFSWVENISDYDKKINDYIDDRDKFAYIKQKDLRSIEIPPQELQKTVGIFKTLSGIDI